jgi:peptide/nickel transport system substrate-binding protein
LKTGTNFWGYVNPKVDALLDSATMAQDLPTVKRYASRAYQQIVDDVPAAWLYTFSTIAAVNRRIVTRPFRADGWWAHLADWSVPADKRIARDRIGLTAKTP